MSKTFVFTPKIGSDGKREVRIPEIGEFVEEGIAPLCILWEPDETQTIKFPILTLTVIEDELEGVKEVWEKNINSGKEISFNVNFENPKQAACFDALLAVLNDFHVAISALAKAMKWGEK